MKEISFGILALIALSGSAALSAPSSLDFSDASNGSSVGFQVDPKSSDLPQCWWWEEVIIYGPNTIADIQGTCPTPKWRKDVWSANKNIWRNGVSWKCFRDLATPQTCQTTKITKVCPIGNCDDPAE